jgi:uncharacterized membrane protein (DUF106 family)
MNVPTAILTTYIICILIGIGFVGLFWCIMQVLTIIVNYYDQETMRAKMFKAMQEAMQEAADRHTANKVVDIRTKQLYKKDGTQ